MVQKVNELGAKLIHQGQRADAANVQQQLTNINDRWSRVLAALVAYRQSLAAALQVHAFNRDVDDTNARIQEKTSLLASDDLGRDLTTVETLIR